MNFWKGQVNDYGWGEYETDEGYLCPSPATCRTRKKDTLSQYMPRYIPFPP